jgi:hypothetical protein
LPSQKYKTLFKKITKGKRAGGTAQVIESLVSSTPVAPKGEIESV